MEPTPLMRGENFGRWAAQDEMACASCCDGRIALVPAAGDDSGMWLRMSGGGDTQSEHLEGDEAEFLAGLLIAYARRNQSKGTVKVPDIQPNSIYGEKQ